MRIKTFLHCNVSPITTAPVAVPSATAMNTWTGMDCCSCPLLVTATSAPQTDDAHLPSCTARSAWTRAAHASGAADLLQPKQRMWWWRSGGVSWDTNTAAAARLSHRDSVIASWSPYWHAVDTVVQSCRCCRSGDDIWSQWWWKYETPASRQRVLQLRREQRAPHHLQTSSEHSVDWMRLLADSIERIRAVPSEQEEAVSETMAATLCDWYHHGRNHVAFCFDCESLQRGLCAFAIAGWRDGGIGPAAVADGPGNDDETRAASAVRRLLDTLASHALDKEACVTLVPKQRAAQMCEW